MSTYRRYRSQGASYFFTVNLFDRSASLLVEYIDVLRTSVRETRARHPFRIEAWVVLPEHMHCIWTLPVGDDDYSVRWWAIKNRFTKKINVQRMVSRSMAAKGERGIWQRRYWEHVIRDPGDFAAHMDYVHVNPLKHGLVSCVADWPFSTFHRYVKAGLYPVHWAGTIHDIVAGERR